MKNLFCVFTTLLVLLFSIGCGSDNNSSNKDSAIREFINFGLDLNHYLWGVDFGRTAFILEDPLESDEKAMLRDTYLQKAYCDLVYDILYEFDLTLANENVYTDRTRPNRPAAPTTITLADSIYTLETSYYGYVDDPEKFERLRATLEYDPTLNKWLLTAYRESTGDNIWLLQEGVIVGDTWYVSLQRDDDGTSYKSNFMLIGIGPSAVLSISGQTGSGEISQGTLYTDGITDANNKWSDFSHFELEPDYELTE